MKKFLFFTLMTSFFVNAQLTPANLALYKNSFPTIRGNYPTDNNLNFLAGQFGTSIDVRQNIYVEGSIISTAIFTSFVFQVTDIKSGVVGYVNTSNPYFTLEEVRDSDNILIPDFAKVNRSYNVKVKGIGSATYPNYGNNCLVMTRPLILSNQTNVRVPQGNASINSIMSPSYDQVSIINFTPYGISPKFRIQRTDIPNQPFYPVATTGFGILFRNTVATTQQLPPTYFVLGATYCVDVAVVRQDATIGDYNDNVSACFTYGSADLKMSNNQDIKTSFEAIISPNPSKDNFNLDIVTSSKSPIEVTVIDINGRIIETKKYTSDGLYNLQIGKNYSPGAYNMTVIQDDNKKSLKLIKN